MTVLNIPARTGQSSMPGMGVRTEVLWINRPLQPRHLWSLDDRVGEVE